MLTLPERSSPRQEAEQRLIDKIGAELRVAAPGIIQSFDSDRQTVEVIVAIREMVVLAGVSSWREIPLLVDVPIVLPRAGGFVLTFPIAPGDECLVVFGDRSMDAWWQSGGIQNQVQRRRHDLSDGYAIPGCWSQPRVVSDYSTDSVQLRTEDGSSYVEIDSGKGITVHSPTSITLQTPLLNLNVGSITSAGASGSGQIATATLNVGALDINSGSTELDGSTIQLTGGNTSIDGKTFLPHEHTGVDPGDGNTGGVA